MLPQYVIFLLFVLSILHNQNFTFLFNAENSYGGNQQPLIDRKILMKVGQNAAAEWKRLGRHLNLDESKLDIIGVEKNGVIDACYNVLKTWQEKEGSRATVQILKETLRNMQRRDIIHEIEKIEGKASLYSRDFVFKGCRTKGTGFEVPDFR